MQRKYEYFVLLTLIIFDLKIQMITSKNVNYNKTVANEEITL